LTQEVVEMAIGRVPVPPEAGPILTARGLDRMPWARAVPVVVVLSILAWAVVAFGAVRLLGH
jgi:hypothetical protein